MKNAFLLLITLQCFLLLLIRAQKPDFFNLDCGGASSHIDDIGLHWTPDNSYLFGQSANTSFTNDNKTQYKTVRYFPDDKAKYCYNINVTTGKRYLVRATFFHGNFYNDNVYPKFDLSLGATLWDSIAIEDPNTPVVTEVVILAPSPSLSVCLFNASLGLRFISTIELRQFNESMYSTLFETQYFMYMAGRVNMGAHSNASIRYPDDPFDRIWESDAIQRQYWLYDVAAGTKKVATNKSVIVDQYERPPEKVMQTAVVGNNGTLSYTTNLKNFPGNAWIYAYFAEIEDLGTNGNRSFKLEKPSAPAVKNLTINVTALAGGNYRTFEGGSSNFTLDYVFTVVYRKNNDSSHGPILNAFEIFKYVLINFGSPDATAMDGLVSNYPQVKWAQEGGDPCLPTPWTWVQCNSDSQPARIISVKLSRKNLTGNIPLQLTKMSDIVELHLDGNILEGAIPDFNGLRNVEIIHLENNRLTGPLPSSLANLPKLKELYVQNNHLFGVIPTELLRKNIIFNYTGNPNLHPRKEAKNVLIIVLSVIGATLLVFIAFLSYFCIWKNKDNKQASFGHLSIEQSNLLNQIDSKSAQRFELSEIEVATGHFNKLIGKGGFGSVYYGKLSDGIDVAVKVHNNESNQGINEFINEVALLSRIHHRHLVKFVGYCKQDDNNILVYEYMNEGTLTEHLRGLPEKKIVSWIKRMEIAEDAAKGIEYLHTGCSPAIIHRDLKSSNILLDKNMRAKVSDFGLSKLMSDSSHVPSMVKGTVGYLDPEYYATQKFTEKSDIYSFGVILLEMISGYNPISSEHFGNDFNYIVSWARELIASGDIHAIIDKSLEPTYDVQSVWKIIELALMCVNESRMERPSISEVLKEIQEAIMIEQKASTGRVESIDIFARKRTGHDPKFSMSYSISESSGSSTSFGESFMKPILR